MLHSGSRKKPPTAPLSASSFYSFSTAPARKNLLAAVGDAADCDDATFRRALRIKGFTHSLVHAWHLNNWLDRPVQATLEVGWHWKYGYCDPNELVGTNRYGSDSPPIAGQPSLCSCSARGLKSFPASGQDAVQPSRCHQARTSRRDSKNLKLNKGVHP